MKPILNPFYFQHSAPNNDKYLLHYAVMPGIFSALLNPESCLVSAPSGYGKSTLSHLVQQETKHKWLHVNLDLQYTANEDFMTILLRQITNEVWHYIEKSPSSLATLQNRSAAIRYFLDLFSAVDVDYLLTCLAEDHPQEREAILAFQAVVPRQLFSPNATSTQRLSILCDCVQKLGIEAIVVWIDISEEWSKIPLPFVGLLEDFFDSLYLMRRNLLYFKCLALPSVCKRIQKLRGIETLSVALYELDWTVDEIRFLIEERLRFSSEQEIASLTDLINMEKILALLQDSSDVHNPKEWLALLHIIIETINQQGRIELDEKVWQSVQRAYFEKQVKIRLDEQGSFWRGNRLLTDLTPRKRAIYPLVRYLYENPGVHRTYKLMDTLGVDETNLNTIISRARKDHLEPFVSVEAEDAWIYLVTDFKGGGYELKHTDRAL